MKAIIEMTRDELRAEARQRNIAGRGSMNKDQLIEAITWARAGDTYVGLEMTGPNEYAEARTDAVLIPRDAERPASRLPTAKMSTARRTSNYMRQNGTTKLTVRQQRQIRRMARRGALDV